MGWQRVGHDWATNALQRYSHFTMCGSFCHTAEWISHTHIYIHISPLPWISFPIRTPQCVVEFPVLCSRFSLVVCFIWVWILQSQSPSSPHPLLSPLCIHVFLLYISVSISSLLIRSSAPFSWILHNFILASTSVCFSANGTSSFLFMAAYFSFFCVS